MQRTHKSIQSLLSIVIVFILIISAYIPQAVQAQADGGIQRQVNAQTGRLSFLVPEGGDVLPAREALGGMPLEDRQADPAMALAKRFGVEFGLREPARELDERERRQFEDGRLAVRYQQTYAGIPVMGGELIVRTNGVGDLYSINGEISADLDLVTETSIRPEQAQQSALQAVAKWYQKPAADFTASGPELWIFDPSLLMPSSRPRELVWRMEVTSVDLMLPVRELVLVNARRGNISLHFNQIDTAWRVEAASQADPPTGPRETVSASEAAALTADVATYTARNGTSLPGTFLCAETNPGCTNGADLHADKAHAYAIGTYNLFAAQHGRNSFDNAGAQLVSTVHYDVEYQNAFWSGTQMVYGDGYGFALADDVVAHELTHGVTQHESNLFYFYQSGAINESFSDLWGEFYDQTNGQGTDTATVAWQIGEDVSGLGAIRDMREPSLFDQPDRMSSTLYAQDVFDNGGVHINSGINNKAAYLLVNGGTFNGKTISALGWAKTAAIYYEVNTNLLTSGADYADLYFAMQIACANLVGQKGITSANCADVKDAIEAVEMQTQPVPGFNTDAPYCDSGEPTFIFSDGIESGTGNWTFNNGGQLRWQVDSIDGPY
ncbi:MAG TPA: M4 family metallopeptidase, partial [Anaerolineales bacterium]|nr:M4 family metallopeptidase [Anaerolineales bacterium]